MILETFLIIFYIMCYLFISNTIMKLLLKWLRIDSGSNNPFLRIFYNNLIFSIIVVVLIATIATKGKSIFILGIPTLFILFRISKRKGHQALTGETPSVKQGIVWLSLLLITVFTVITSYYLALRFSLRNDVVHYTKVAEYLVGQGIENAFHYYNQENKILNGCNPYHYFEMWFGGTIFQVVRLMNPTKMSDYMLFMYMVFNLFRIIAVIGIFGLLNKFIKFNIYYFAAIFALLLVDISAFCEWWNDSFIAESNPFTRPNFIFYYLLLVPIIDSLFNQERDKFVLWSALFIICSITALPAVGGCAILVLVYDFFFQKETRKQTIKTAFLFFGFLLCIPVFYKLFGMAREVMPVENYSIGTLISMTLHIWKACVFMFVMLFLKISLIITFSYLLSRTKWVKSLNISAQLTEILAYTFLLNLVGIALFQMVPYLDNMYQFAFIGYCLAFLVVTLVIVLTISKTTGIARIATLAVFILLYTFVHYKNNMSGKIEFKKVNWQVPLAQNFLQQQDMDPSFIEALQKKAGELEKRNGASIMDSADVMTEFSGLRHSGTYQLGNYMMAFNNKVNLPLISDPETLYPDTDKTSKAYYKAFKFNNLTKFYMEYKKSIPYKENLLHYISTNNITYLFASKNFNARRYMDSSRINEIIVEKSKGHQLIILK